jgi:hypothetical protein
MIYAVIGVTGEYSDRREWAVDAWRTEVKARARVESLARRIQELGITRDSRYTDGYDEKVKTMRESDPEFDHDYTGTDYYVVPIELKQ